MKKFLAPLCCLGLLFTACKKEATESSLNNSSYSTNMQPVSPQAMYSTTPDNKLRIRNTLESAAITFAKFVGNSVEFRALLKQRALTRFDGDYDVLYNSIKNYTLSNGKTVEQALVALNSNFAVIAGNIPKFNVSVPVECDTWTTATFIPNVAVQPFGQREDSLVNIRTYKANGTLQLMSASVDPTVPVVVLGVCERVDENEQLRPEFVGGPDGGRLSGASEIVEKINCPNLSHIESWSSGAPELWLTVNGFISNSHVSQPPSAFAVQELTKQFFKPGKRKDIDGRDWTCNRALFNWYTNTATSTTVYADGLNYRWLEEDYFVAGGGEDITQSYTSAIKVNTNGTDQTYTPTTSITWHLQDDDDDCGHNMVHFNDPITNTYTTGLVQWKEKN